MTSKIAIINRALTKLGSQPLMSESDNNQASRTVEAIYDGLLDRLLRTYRWAFAIKRANLAASSAAPDGYTYQYQLPSDCLRVDRVGPYWRHELCDPLFEYRPIYQIEGRSILTDTEAPLHLRYGARITDTTLYDACFSEAFSCMLAAEMCESINQSSTKKQAAMQDFDIAIKEARSVSAIERPPIRQQETSWYTARL